MKLVSFSELNRPAGPGSIRPGVLLDEGSRVIDLTTAGHADALAAITAGVTALTNGGAYRGYAVDEIKLHAPLSNPPRIFCIGLNYRDHAIESGMEIPKFPVVFFKMVPSIVGPGDTIVIPEITKEPDYEAEFAFVIGKGGFQIPASKAMDHVYGYTIINDVSARDIQFSTSQWSLSKSLPTFCPMGPSIVTADEIADPHALDVQLAIDGEVLQHSNTRELIFKIPELIEYISSITPLLPGDIVSTGTPFGVGLGRNPKRWLKAGETVTITIEGLGQLTNPVA
ncbi:fumarylacetoacetate hydrolase family protein [Acidicapsa acidisoli]|uniref:fumarylacetoacetate hydrolase family protein n=1 Tax=Acidicapsa acidisoli TaxID=1615681 RepID=UPI0021E03547|nr:fumarylacetoacetate hydrolase family protein [Acidicapsa acidisoli]